MGLINIYAPNATSKRSQFWEQMLLDLPKYCDWIFCGDFNIVEKMEDKTLACGHILLNKEKFVWQKKMF
jgi:hypothetical protein